METSELVLDSLGRVHELVPAVLDGLTADDVAWQPDPGANSIGWLIWHLTRAEDGHLSELAGADQVWTSARWQQRFALPYPQAAGGFGMSADDVAAFRVEDVALLTGYSADVAERARTVVGGLTSSDYDRIVDSHWDPPVTLGVRLVSVMVETAQHIGQAAYLRGLLERGKGSDSGWKGYV